MPALSKACFESSTEIGNLKKKPNKEQSMGDAHPEMLIFAVVMLVIGTAF